MTKENVTLDFPNLQAFDSYIEALKEGYRIGIQPQTNSEQIAEISTNPAAHLQALNEQKSGVITTPDGSQFPFVPYEFLWLTQGKEFIGSLSFRLELSELLKQFGGHIGFGIRPKYQRQGFGKLALRLAKDRAASIHGINRLLLTCSPDNPGSEKIIISNGGIYENTTKDTFGYLGEHKRFWIETRA